MRYLVIASLVVIATGMVGSPARATDSQLLDFKLEDQFERLHRRAEVLGTVVVVIASDRNGSQFSGSWGTAIRRAIGDHPRYDEISHLELADLRGVPFFIKGSVRGKFPQETEQWVLMDWKGSFAKAYDFPPDAANVLVFGPDGALVHQAAGQEPEPEAVRGVADALRSLLAAD